MRSRNTSRRFKNRLPGCFSEGNPALAARKACMSSFDLVADRFERYRALPSHVPVAIRQALHAHGGIDAGGRLLEVGCGTGRIGAQFNAAGDNYCGLDLSMQMLRE